MIRTKARKGTPKGRKATKPVTPARGTTADKAGKSAKTTDAARKGKLEALCGFIRTVSAQVDAGWKFSMPSKPPAYKAPARIPAAMTPHVLAGLSRGGDNTPKQPDMAAMISLGAYIAPKLRQKPNARYILVRWDNTANTARVWLAPDKKAVRTLAGKAGGDNVQVEIVSLDTGKITTALSNLDSWQLTGPGSLNTVARG